MAPSLSSAVMHVHDHVDVYDTPASAVTRAALRDFLALEIDLYEFLRQRLLRQHHWLFSSRMSVVEIV